MNKTILIGVWILLFVSFANADLISINSGGSENIVIHPGSIIEKFFFGSDVTLSLIDNWEFATVFSLMGVSLFFVIVSVHKKQKWLNKFMRIGIFSLVPMMLLTVSFVSAEISQESGITSLMSEIYKINTYLLTFYFYGLFIFVLIGIINGVMELWQEKSF